ncbi:MAG: hypothetical protein FYV88_4850, partial [Bacteroidetes bacterium]|nr:hypothetical protein [Bacteroidota bacterium]
MINKLNTNCMIEIKIPSIGESISEVTLLKWTQPEGAWVERDQVIAELESEKATFEVNAEQAGTLQHLAKEGDSLRIGDIVAKIDETAARPAEVPVAEKTEAPAAAPATPPAAPSTVPAPKATPVASAIIANTQVDVAAIKPTGVHGKIVKQDVLDVLKNPG